MPRATLAFVVAFALAACGSTVPAAQRQAAGGGSELSVGSAGPGGKQLAKGATGDGTGTAGGGGAATGGSGRAGAARAGASGSGGAATAGKGPIEIGIVRTGVSNAAAYGVSLGNTVSEAEIYDALVATFNDKGGIAGRRIIPVYDDTDTASASWDADFEAVCAKFTQDHRVVAVLGYVFDYVTAFESCLAKKGIPHLSTSFNVPDAEELAKSPLLMALSTPRIERRSLVKIDGGLATGVLTKASKLGVLVDSCPGTKRAWEKVTKPYILSKGLQIADEFEFGCPRGQAEAAAVAGQAGNLVLQFRAAGVDRVLINAVSEGPAVLILANAAEAQGWRPWYVVSSLANAATLGGQMPAGQAQNIHGYGWLPVQDVNPPQWPGSTPAQERCIALLAQKQIRLQSPADYSFAFNLCEALFLYEVALQATGGRVDGPLVGAAIEAVGSSFQSTMNLEGRSTYSRSQHDAPSLARYFAWHPPCSCFTYRPTAVPIPDA